MYAALITYKGLKKFWDFNLKMIIESKHRGGK